MTPVTLDPASEEIATLYAKFIPTDYVKSSVFRKNFWKDWKQILGPEHVVRDLAGCDFTAIYDHLVKMKEQKKLTKASEDNLDLDAKYKTAIVDGVPQPVGNFRLEPPGIFLGRGCNPKLGKVKRRIYPEDITINIDSKAKIPEPLEGHVWGAVIHDPYVEWLASWKDDITGKTKYVWLGAQSDFKARSDMEKFELARKLKRRIKTIRAENELNLTNGDPKIRQVATALYFIDLFALRVGNEKGEDETDTVGVTSLRVQHIELLENDKMKLDFLGKDSVRYNRVLGVSSSIYSNIKNFMMDKEPGDQLFDLVSPPDVNRYLQSFLKNLTAKVFRTFNASYLFQKELSKVSKKYDTYTESDKINLLLDEFNKANAKVALLCNHQKNITKSNVARIDKINENIKKQKLKLRRAKSAVKKNPEKISTLEKKIKILRSKKELMIELKNISLGTSKVNYIDPRITVAFMKTHQIPIDKIFPKTLQEKFKWAFEVDQDFKF